MLDQPVQRGEAEVLVEPVGSGLALRVDSDRGVVEADLPKCHQRVVDQSRGDTPFAIVGMGAERSNQSFKSSGHLLVVGEVEVQHRSDHLPIGHGVEAQVGAKAETFALVLPSGLVTGGRAPVITKGQVHQEPDFLGAVVGPGDDLNAGQRRSLVFGAQRTEQVGEVPNRLEPIRLIEVDGVLFVNRRRGF